MTDQHPADRPGHLDIDAVSAFVDRDLEPDDLATIEFHLRECPPCFREVLEIQSTVVLLASLPQYTPRRSFCLGHEHARAGRRRLPSGLSWSGPFTQAPSPGSATPAVAHADAGRAAGWLPGLQAAAMVVGVLLVLVTTSDLMGMPPQPAEWLSDPEASVRQMEFQAAPAAEMAPRASAPEAVSDGDTALAPAGSSAEPSFRVESEPSEGTTDSSSASEELAEDGETANLDSGVATSVALAAVTQAVPSPAAGFASGPETAAADADAPAATDAPPYRLRLAQLILAFALAWLVVTIVGLRWVRGLRRAGS